MLIVLIKFQSTPSMRRVTTKHKSKTDSKREFQSTPSMRRVTPRYSQYPYIRRISIHTLHAEGDVTRFRYRQWCMIFQSTPSMRRVTDFKTILNFYSWISIHTLHAEGDI